MTFRGKILGFPSFPNEVRNGQKPDGFDDPPAYKNLHLSGCQDNISLSNTNLFNDNLHFPTVKAAFVSAAMRFLFAILALFAITAAASPGPVPNARVARALQERESVSNKSPSGPGLGSAIAGG
ncbi:hypothetical protein MMC08_006620 [Hypocenomyce scalaris]|nr:hypothetical protein [Hypocenomyce scalaris]